MLQNDLRRHDSRLANFVRHSARLLGEEEPRRQDLQGVRLHRLSVLRSTHEGEDFLVPQEEDVWLLRSTHDGEDFWVPRSAMTEKTDGRPVDDDVLEIVLRVWKEETIN